MPSLWGSKNQNTDASSDSPPRRSEDDHDDSSSVQNPPPNEHTRLLPNRLDSSDGGTRPPRYLTPDDPAVSPYNLWTVRLVRWVSLLFAAVSFVWWVLLLVSMFVTPPGFHSRGSPFYAFSYATLSFANVGFALIFFAAPSRSVRILSIIMAVLLAVNVIITVSVERTRHEEGWVGITSVIWALLMSLWALLADRTVKWGKAEEEERLTGRVETRRSVLEWSEVLISTIANAILTAVIVLLTLTLILRSLDAGVKPPGTRYWVDGGKYQVHLHCQGNASARGGDGQKLPTVLLEGGERPVEDGLWQLAEAAVANGSFARYCFADRPGYAWSDAAPSPLSAGVAVDALSEALARADESGPWVVAAAGVGALYARVFSARHAKEVAGLLLVDPLPESLLDRELAGRGRGFLLWLRGVFAPLGLDRLPGAVFRGRSGADRVWGRAAKQSPKTVFARLQEALVADSLTKRDVTSARAIQYPGTPLAVVSSGREMKRDKRWAEGQRDMSHVTHNLKHWDIVDKAPHRVWEEKAGWDKIEKRLKQLVHDGA